MSVLVTPAVYPRVFEILTTLTIGALRKKVTVCHRHSRTSQQKQKQKKKMKPRSPRVVSNVS